MCFREPVLSSHSIKAVENFKDSFNSLSLCIIVNFTLTFSSFLILNLFWRASAGRFQCEKPDFVPYEISMYQTMYYQSFSLSIRSFYWKVNLDGLLWFWYIKTDGSRPTESQKRDALQRSIRFSTSWYFFSLQIVDFDKI